MPATNGAEPPPTVGLFVTCLVDLHRPNVGFASIRLLEEAGFEVVVPGAQTCCGQPAYNAGDRASARDIARQVIVAFEGLEHVVAPSGSCAGMLIAHYPGLFEDEPDWRARAEALAARTFELLSFIAVHRPAESDDVRANDTPDATYDGVVTYHDACSGLRELDIKAQPRDLLARVRGLELREMADTEVCCGFGGTFCVKFPEISERMASDKIALAAQTGADTLVGGDLGCLLNLAGRLRRTGVPMRVWHTAEILAGLTDVPAIGERARDGAKR